METQKAKFVSKNSLLCPRNKVVFKNDFKTIFYFY